MFDFHYKKNIQFLRGLSVIFVFLYHTNIPLFQKGYLGVDVFFVISGFVITQRIFQNYKIDKKINLSEFYLKRFKRIIPNLLFIVGLTYLIYLLFGPPDLSLWNETLSALFGVSNFYYIVHDIGYFDNIFDDPLAHTWSLGVEEQFYLFYPLLIFLIFSLSKKKILNLQITLILIFFISLFFFKSQIETNPVLGFYLSPLRFWELIFGGILFINTHRIKKNNTLSFISLIIIIFLIFSGYEYNYFYLNLIIVLLSGLFIVSFSRSKFIENGVFVYFGNISYSFYLWHLPILFFLDLYVANNFYLDVILSFIFTTFFSAVTYKFIEQKFRYFKFKEIKKLAISVISIFLIFLTSLIYIKYLDNNLRAKIRNYIYEVNYLNYKHNWNNRVPFNKLIYLGKNKIYDHCEDSSKVFSINQDNLKNECLRQKNYKTLFYIEGNSHTAQFIPIFNKLSFLDNVYYKHAINYNISVNQVNKLSNKFSEIIYVTNIDNLKKLKKISLSYPEFNNNIKFIFFKSTPYPKNKYQPFKCLIQQIDCSVDKFQDYEKRSLEKLFSEIEKFKMTSNRVFIFNSYDILCPQKKCIVYDKDKDLLIYRDASHLVVEGSETLTPKFKEFIINLKNQNLINN